MNYANLSLNNEPLVRKVYQYNMFCENKGTDVRHPNHKTYYKSDPSR